MIYFALFNIIRDIILPYMKIIIKLFIQVYFNILFIVNSYSI